MQLIYFLNDKIFCLISNICFWHFFLDNSRISCKFHHHVGYIQVLMHFFFSYIARLIIFVAYLYPPQNNMSYDNLYKLSFVISYNSHNYLYPIIILYISEFGTSGLSAHNFHILKHIEMFTSFHFLLANHVYVYFS